MGTPSFRRSSPGDFTLPKRRKSVNSRYESALLGKSRSNMSPAFSTIAADSPRRVSACRTSSVLRISTRGPSCSLHPESDRSGSCLVHSRTASLTAWRARTSGLSMLSSCMQWSKRTWRAASSLISARSLAAGAAAGDAAKPSSAIAAREEPPVVSLFCLPSRLSNVNAHGALGTYPPNP